MERIGILRHHLRCAGTGWSMGSYGAIAEFHRDPDEATAPIDPDALTCITDRGGIRLENVGEATPVAYEALSRDRRRWTQGVALCLPAGRAAMSGRTQLTEIGPDRGALRQQDRDAILFDIGVCAGGANQSCVDFCIRTGDPELIAILREGADCSFLDIAHPAMAAIFQKNPHRIALTALGRVEVYAPIAGSATDDMSPTGPHTHVLPALMATGRLFADDLPVPDGMVPAAMMYPASPIHAATDDAPAFDEARHDAFQQLFWQWGAQTQREIKRRALLALCNGEDPDRFECPDSAHAQTAIRVLCRQLRRDTRVAVDPDLLQRWCDRFEREASAQTTDR